MSQRGILFPLAVVWIAGVSLSALLLWIDLRRPWKFFWLLPYPTWRTVVPTAVQLVAQLFAQRPLAAIAVVVIPLATLAATVALFVAALRHRA